MLTVSLFVCVSVLHLWFTVLAQALVWALSRMSLLISRSGSVDHQCSSGFAGAKWCRPRAKVGTARVRTRQQMCRRSKRLVSSSEAMAAWVHILPASALGVVVSDDKHASMLFAEINTNAKCIVDSAKPLSASVADEKFMAIEAVDGVKRNHLISASGNHGRSCGKRRFIATFCCFFGVSV